MVAEVGGTLGHTDIASGRRWKGTIHVKGDHRLGQGWKAH